MCASLCSPNSQPAKQAKYIQYSTSRPFVWLCCVCLRHTGDPDVIRRSLHHFTLRIGDKVDKVSTLRLKPCMDPAAPPALPRVWGSLPAAVRFWDFPPPGAVVARRVHFQLPAEPRREPFSPGTPPGVFARPAAVLDHTAALPARNHRALSRLDL